LEGVIQEAEEWKGVCNKRNVEGKNNCEEKPECCALGKEYSY
jgi:hypothetical protein